MTPVSKSCPRYNGAEKPNSWLSDYALAVEIAGGGGLVAARFLLLMLEGTARSWIENLPEKSVHNWKDMERVFTQHFQGTYKRPSTYTDLTRCVQKPEETATQFLARWIQTKASCENVDDNQAIHATSREVPFYGMTFCGAPEYTCATNTFQWRTVYNAPQNTVAHVS